MAGMHRDRSATPLWRLVRGPRPTREAIVTAALIALILQLAYLAAFFVRGELLLRSADARTIVATIWFVVGIKLAVCYWRGLCHRPWRRAGMEDLNRLLRAATTGLLLLVACNYFLLPVLIPGWTTIPRSVLLLDCVFTILGIGGLQVVARNVHDQIIPATAVGGERVALVVDASPVGRELARRLPDLEGGPYFVAGLLDDAPDTYGLRVGNARVLGPVSVAAACAERLRASEIVVLSGAIFGRTLQNLCDDCAASGLLVRIAEPVAPDHDADAGAARQPFHIRDVGLQDMLSRPQARLEDHDASVLPFLRGRTVLVTGAGGSIGSEICRQLLRFGPAKLLLVERSECALFTIHRELAGGPRGGGTVLEPILCDVADATAADRILAAHRPEVVIHAAAFKHVPLMESHPAAAIENNALATATLAEASAAHGVEAFVCLSTDKAVHPSSVMGASKLVAERFLQAFGGSSATRFVVVRFGNVIGSSGSAVPIFEEQLSRRLPITVTHEAVRRYFMTINEAAQLVLLAGSYAGRGATYVLEMGESIPIVDLVHRLAFVMKVPADEVEIRYCGLRPGEKLDEELFFEDEIRHETCNPLVIRVTREPRPLPQVRRWLDELRRVAAARPEEAGAVLMEIVRGDCGDGPGAPDAASPTRFAEHPA